MKYTTDELISIGKMIERGLRGEPLLPPQQYRCVRCSRVLYDAGYDPVCKPCGGDAEGYPDVVLEVQNTFLGQPKWQVFGRFPTWRQAEQVAAAFPALNFRAQYQGKTYVFHCGDHYTPNMFVLAR